MAKQNKCFYKIEDPNHLRNQGLDTIAGLLIIYMIFGHCSQLADCRENIIYVYANRLFYFFMAWFFYKSGMFHNNAKSIEIKKTALRLLKPYAIYTIMGQVLHN